MKRHSEARAQSEDISSDVMKEVVTALRKRIRKVDHSFDIPYIAGYSRDGRTIYIADASIFGTATIDGSGTYDFRIDLKDVAEPGRGMDTYRIRLSTVPLYDSGEHTLEGGNVQIHK